ncbi:hypothetical protein [Streptomyces sp. NBC_00519]|uniref:hypothetical protein n=1 Tax=Streptomyces sp. NBC_00519 TaxID=2975764 RepID=UPI0030E02614
MTQQDSLLVYFALACMWIGGYAAGRGRVAKALVAWADRQVGHASRRSPRFWIALPVVLAAAACLWTFRPRRTLNSYRAWKAWQNPAAARGLDTNGDI